MLVGKFSFVWQGIYNSGMLAEEAMLTSILGIFGIQQYSRLSRWTLNTSYDKFYDSFIGSFYEDLNFLLHKMTWNVFSSNETQLLRKHKLNYLLNY